MLTAPCHPAAADPQPQLLQPLPKQRRQIFCQCCWMCQAERDSRPGQLAPLHPPRLVRIADCSEHSAGGAARGTQHLCHNQPSEGCLGPIVASVQPCRSASTATAAGCAPLLASSRRAVLHRSIAISAGMWRRHRRGRNLCCSSVSDMLGVHCRHRSEVAQRSVHCGCAVCRCGAAALPAARCRPEHRYVPSLCLLAAC